MILSMTMHAADIQAEPGVAEQAKSSRKLRHEVLPFSGQI